METTSHEDNGKEPTDEKLKRKSHRDSVLGEKRSIQSMGIAYIEDGKVSYGNLIKESMDETWFGMVMTSEEKIEARRPWRNSLIIKPRQGKWEFSRPPTYDPAFGFTLMLGLGLMDQIAADL